MRRKSKRPRAARMANDPELCRLLSRLGGCYQAQIEAELAKGPNADQTKIAAAFAARPGG